MHKKIVAGVAQTAVRLKAERKSLQSEPLTDMQTKNRPNIDQALDQI